MIDLFEGWLTEERRRQQNVLEFLKTKPNFRDPDLMDSRLPHKLIFLSGKKALTTYKTTCYACLAMLYPETIQKTGI